MKLSEHAAEGNSCSRSWLILAGAAVLLGALYWSPLGYMVSVWQQDDFNYGYFIPVMTAYLLWEKRASIARQPNVPSWRGMIPVLVGLVLFWLGKLGGEYTVQFLSLWLVSTGLLWILFGREKLKSIAFPLGFSLTMFPPPNMLSSSLTLKLKLISSALGVKMIQWYGMSAYREGNVIDVGFTQLQVVDACSGLRFFFPLIVLAILMAHFFHDRMWKRLVIVASAIPVSIVTNSLRIASVGILYQFWGPSVAEGFFHDFSGWFIFMFSLGILLVEMWILRRIHPVAPVSADFAAESAASVKSREGSSTGRLVPVPMMVAALLLGASLLAAHGIEFREKVLLKQPFATFPEQLAEWNGSRQQLEQEYLDALDLSDYVIINYRNAVGRQVSFYTAYNASQREGKSSHSPSTCLPGNGWLFNESGNSTVDLPQGRKVEVQRAVMEKNGQKQLVYYWFPQRGRVLHNLYELKLYAFWDALTKHRTDGALVRIITPIPEGEELKEADSRLQGFVRLIVPVLDRYLPGKDI